MEWPLRHGCEGRLAFVHPLSLTPFDSSPSRRASGEEAKLCGMPRPPLDRGGGTASAVTERLSLARASRSGCPLYNLSVCFADKAGLRLPAIQPEQGKPAYSTGNKQTKTPPTVQKPSAAFCTYSVNSGQQIRPWPRCCALPSCRRRRSGTRCSDPERSAGQPG